MQFGKPNRPSTPIGGVISNYYGETALHDIEERYNIQVEMVRLTHLQLYRRSKIRDSINPRRQRVMKELKTMLSTRWNTKMRSHSSSLRDSRMLKLGLRPTGKRERLRMKVLNKKNESTIIH